jgi:hypothetical protein
MSIQRVPKTEGMRQTISASTQLPLTFENLATHERNTPADHPSCVRMQRWLACSGDTLLLGRIANNWDQLIEKDEVAAAIESATNRRET